MGISPEGTLYRVMVGNTGLLHRITHNLALILHSNVRVFR